MGFRFETCSVRGNGYAARPLGKSSLACQSFWVAVDLVTCEEFGEQHRVESDYNVSE